VSAKGFSTKLEREDTDQCSFQAVKERWYRKQFL
jgi:hypothetical protein